MRVEMTTGTPKPAKKTHDIFERSSKSTFQAKKTHDIFERSSKSTFD